MTPEVLYEDNHLLVVNKPAGMVTQGAHGRQLSLYHWASNYIKRTFQKPGNVYLGVVSRLDRPVSGVVILARTSKAAARLSAAYRTRQVDKIYWALLCPGPQAEKGIWVDSLVRDQAHGVTRVVKASPATPRALNDLQASSAKGQEAELCFQVLQRYGQIALVEIRLITGRKHQIRAQASGHGHPVVGDRKYGSRLSFPEGIALHARRVSFPHPTRKTPIQVSASLPPSWYQFLPRGLPVDSDQEEKPQ